MEYLPPVVGPQPQQGAPVDGAGKYHGAIAQGYDAKREQSPKWLIEQAIIGGMLDDLPSGSVILDCPVGTGRFLDFYISKGFQFIGADLSGDMLIQSALKLAPQSQVEQWVNTCNARNQILPLRIKDKGMLVNGDIRQIGLADKSVDAAVMCRLTRWLSPDDCQRALRELQRVSRQRIILTARIANHPHARTVELFQSTLNEEWRLFRNEVGCDIDYRILMFSRDA